MTPTSPRRCSDQELAEIIDGFRSAERVQIQGLAASGDLRPCLAIIEQARGETAPGGLSERELAAVIDAGRALRENGVTLHDDAGSPAYFAPADIPGSVFNGGQGQVRREPSAGLDQSGPAAFKR